MKLKWLPIESAPKDGTKIILRGKNKDEIDIVWYWKTYEQWGFSVIDEDIGLKYQPTHWMPIPEFEEEEEGEICEWSAFTSKQLRLSYGKLYITSCELNYFGEILEFFKFCPACSKKIKLINHHRDQSIKGNL